MPYLAIIGAEEAAAGAVALRLRDGRRLARMSAAEALDRIGALLAVHSAELWDVM
ncbi:His/Gly/Thr/Pro-type tRNA ligase C-terminal domain-containing protein [Nocardia sp. NPDC047654]|uniref:His/Gly/Thr/Pro-type tRNA ligase C-terminal domain-containing protein n=1 Tax=Nocardia sp. NPDC047654 TaxID=3364314 RepID=UPI0037223DEA